MRTASIVSYRGSRQVGIVDAAGHTTRYDYDALNRVTAITAPDNA